MTANQKPIRRSENPFRSVLIFIVRQWWREGRLLFGTAGAMIAATLADILLPVYAGQLVDAVANSAANRNAALDAGLWALGAIVVLGLAMLVLRTASILFIMSLTLRMMSVAARDAFWRVHHGTLIRRKNGVYRRLFERQALALVEGMA